MSILLYMDTPSIAPVRPKRNANAADIIMLIAKGKNAHFDSQNKACQYTTGEHHSLTRFDGRSSESSPRPLRLVPGRLLVRMSLSSWLTRRCG